MRREWTLKKFFVSSTFEDMGPERDLLVRKVAPRLRALGEDSSCHVAEVDLRWGIPVTGLGERSLVVQRCLEAVDACRPHLVAFLGERRGRLVGTADFEDGFLQDNPRLQRALDLGLSLTELEILHAVRPVVGSSAPSSVMLYMRDDDEMWSGPLAGALEECGVDLRSGPRTGVTVRHYRKTVTANGRTELRSGADTLEDRLVADLSDLLDLDAGDHPGVSDESDFHDRARALAANGVAGPAALGTILPEAPTSTGRLVVVDAPSGSGKTTWLARLATEMSSHFDDGVIARFYGSALPPDDEDALISSLLGEVQRATGNAEASTHRRSLLTRWSESWSAFSGRVPALVLDAIDAAPVDPTALHWLDAPLQHGAAVVMSLDGDTDLGGKLRAALERHPLAEMRSLPGLTEPSMRAEFVRQRLTTHLKTLANDELRALVEHPAGSDPLFLSIVLAELRLHGRHEDLIEQIVHRFGAGREAAIESLLDRIEVDSGSDITVVLGALANSPSGLSTSQLAELLEDSDTTLDSEGRVEDLLRQLDAFMQRRPHAHAIATRAFATVAERRYAGPWDERLADLHLSQQADDRAPADSAARSRALRDIPHHLRRAERVEELTEYLLDPDQVIERLREFGAGGLSAELKSCPTSIRSTEVKELRHLLDAAGDQLSELDRLRRPLESEVAQLLAIQAGVLGLANLEESFAQRLAGSAYSGRVRWADGRGARSTAINSEADWCTQLALDPDEHWLIRVAERRTAIMYNTETLREHCRFDAARVCFSPNGTQLALATKDGRLDVADVATGAVTRTWQCWNGTPADLCWIGQALVAAVEDEIVAVDTATGRSTACPCPGISAIAHHAPTGDVIFGTRSGELGRVALPIRSSSSVKRIGVAQTRSEDNSIRRFNEPIDQIIASQSRSIAWALNRISILIQWDLHTGESDLEFREFRPLSAILVDADERTLIAATGAGELAVHDLESRERTTIKCLQHSAEYAVSGVSGRAWVASQPGIEDSEIVAVDLHGDSAVPDNIHAVALSPDGQLAVDARSWGEVWVRNACTGEDYFDLQPNGIQRNYSCRFNRSGHVLMLGSLDRLTVIDPWEQTVLAGLGAYGSWDTTAFDGVRAIGISPDDQFFVAGDSNGHVATFNRMYEAIAVAALEAVPSAIEVLPSHHVLVLTEAGELTLRDPALNIVRRWPSAGDRAWTMAVAADSGEFYTAHRGGQIARWSIESTSEPELLDGGIGEIEDLMVTGDERFLIAAGRSGHVRFWDRNAGTALLSLPFPGAVENIALSDRADTLMVSLAQATVVVLDLFGFESREQ
jgi:WD40 repeat protein